MSTHASTDDLSRFDSTVNLAFASLIGLTLGVVTANIDGPTVKLAVIAVVGLIAGYKLVQSTTVRTHALLLAPMLAFGIFAAQAPHVWSLSIFAVAAIVIFLAIFRIAQLAVRNH